MSAKEAREMFCSVMLSVNVFCKTKERNNFKMKGVYYLGRKLQNKQDDSDFCRTFFYLQFDCCSMNSSSEF